MSDHIHILTSIHPAISLSEFVKIIKTSTTIWIKENKIFPHFVSWQPGYGAFTVSINDKANVIKYIKNQQLHHQNKSFIEEYKKILELAEIDYDEKYEL
jgi:putative transposase